MNLVRKGADLGVIDGARRSRFDLGSLPLLAGTYTLTVGAHPPSGRVSDHWEQKRRFEVAAGGRDQGMISLPVTITTD